MPAAAAAARGEERVVEAIKVVGTGHYTGVKITPTLPPTRPSPTPTPPPPHTPPTTITLPALQRDVLGGVDYCKRKVLLVREKVDQLMQLVKARQGGLAQVEALLERMEAQAQAQQQQGPPLK